MITLKNALTKSEGELKEIKQDLIKKIKDNIELNAYIGNVQESGSGVPILIKDNINVKGWEITCASRILKGYISPYDAQVITKIHQNKMCAFGRANMDEFAMGSTSESSCYGRVKNPFDTSRVPGGSSGGSAAAVAAGIAIASLGSDTGGSIRQLQDFVAVWG